ncbi:MAG TPA: uracil-DNA glycosylase [Ktedonobacterales bacterium]|nr:uracil-DNA glycosylase [Ktedonobacterales bacterium]
MSIPPTTAQSEPADPLAQINAEIAACQRCDLYQHARHAVSGEGDPHAEVFLIGEAPSAYDDRNGRPFSGPSGVLLDELLALAGLSRTQVFLTNVVKHHPQEGHSLTPDEITACAGYLTRQIAAVNPRVVVTLGSYALARFGSAFPRMKITQAHGQARLANRRLVVAMYNPAAALHREELLATVKKDFQLVLPAALAEARRLAAEGKLGQPDQPANADDAPQQMTLF